MTNKKRSRKLLALLFCIFISPNSLFAQDDSPPVTELKRLYSSNSDFKADVDLMLENVHPLADGSENPWKDKGVEDLYEYMNEWFYFLPNSHNGLDRIATFSLLFYKNPYGDKFILQEPGLSWSLYFIEERGKYMDSPESTAGIDVWLTDETLANDDFVLPSQGFNSFNEFFTRDLKPGARHIDNVGDDSIISSPADGVLNMIANDLELETEIPTKGSMTMSLSKLLDSSTYSERFVGWYSAGSFSDAGQLPPFPRACFGRDD